MPFHVDRFLLACAFVGSVAADVGLEAAEEFHTFVTRPDLKPPKWNVTYHDKSRIAPGYWFVAPYNREDNNVVDVKWQTCQVGPTIYDNDGELVWSGACDFANHMVWNFQQSVYWDRKRVLAGVVQEASSPEDVGTGWFLGSDYKIKHSVAVEQSKGALDLHEFNTFARGRRALVTFSGKTQYWGADAGINHMIRSKDNGFREIDTMTGRVLFNWRCVQHLSPAESTAPIHQKMYQSGAEGLWDPFHINSVDKNEDGDYLVSLRHADLILLVSGRDGSIKWRAGGVNSDFVMDDFVWSRQHHPRFLESTGSHTTISFLDNAASGLMATQEPTNNGSRALIVRLHHPRGRPTTAELLRHYDRPDGNWTVKRGSMQLLGNGNVFAVWTDGGYLTEFAADGTPLLEARWLNATRFATYRGYKFDGWIGRPQDRPRLVTVTAGTADVAVSTMYVSWNGATEVAAWAFYERTRGTESLLGRTNRTGFETSLVVPGRPAQVLAKALDGNGEVLGGSGWVEPRTLGIGSAQVAEGSGAGWRHYIEAARDHSAYAPVAVLGAVVGCCIVVWIVLRSRPSRGGWASDGTRGGYWAVPREEEA